MKKQTLDNKMIVIKSLYIFLVLTVVVLSSVVRAQQVNAPLMLRWINDERSRAGSPSLTLDE